MVTCHLSISDGWSRSMDQGNIFITNVKQTITGISIQSNLFLASIYLSTGKTTTARKTYCLKVVPDILVEVDFYILFSKPLR